MDPPFSTKPDLVYALIKEVFLQGLDVAGIRLVYSPTLSAAYGLGGNFNLNSNSQVNGSASLLCNSTATKPTLALAIRGPNAISRMAEAVGPTDITVAKSLEPGCLNARFGVEGGREGGGDSRERSVISSIHSQYWSGLELARWFSGRACLRTGSILGVSDPTTKSERRKRQRVRFSESEDGEVETPTLTPLSLTFPPLVSNRSVLKSLPYSKMVFVASPLIPPTCYAALLLSLTNQGLDILGVKRLRLNSKRAMALSIPSSSIPFFTPSSSTPPSPAVGYADSPPSLLSIAEHTLSSTSNSTYPPLPSLLIAVGRENAITHISAVQQRTLKDLHDYLSTSGCHSAHSAHSALLPYLSDTPSGLIYVTSYTDEVLKAIGNFAFTPSTANGYKLSATLLAQKGVREEVAFVGITGVCDSQLEKAASILSSLMGVPSACPFSSFTRGFKERDVSCAMEEDGLGSLELMGLKVVPEVSRYQAKQLCPLSSSHPSYQEGVDQISSRPALLLVLRGLNSNDRAQKLTERPGGMRTLLSPGLRSCEVISSHSLEHAFHLTSVFFIDKELFSHPDSWALAGFTPPCWLGDCAVLSRLQSEPEPLLSVCTVDADQPRCVCMWVCVCVCVCVCVYR